MLTSRRRPSPRPIPAAPLIEKSQLAKAEGRVSGSVGVKDTRRVPMPKAPRVALAGALAAGVNKAGVPYQCNFKEYKAF